MAKKVKFGLSTAPRAKPKKDRVDTKKAQINTKKEWVNTEESS